jgi:hypothetical protein
MSIKDGPSCPGCGLPNYEGMCPHCTGDQVRYEEELVPPFPSSLPDEDDGMSIVKLRSAGPSSGGRG